MKTLGDGFLAVFDGPARAIQCALEIQRAVGPLGLELRAGLHTGEVQLADGDVEGIAVHLAARIAAMAESNQVLVSRTVKDLVAGSRLSLVDAGTHSFKGIPDEWRVYSVSA